MKGSTLLLGSMGLLGARALLGPARTVRDSEPKAAAVREKVDQVLERVKPRTESLLRELELWPVPPEAVTSLGDNVRARNGAHEGLDIHVPAATPVRAPEALRVTQVKDGTKSPPGTRSWKAGMFVDAEGAGGRVLRFQHLESGSVRVREGDQLRAGDAIGVVTHKGDAGLVRSEPHLHFEVRRPGTSPHTYGAILNPADLLPIAGSPEVRQQLQARRSQGGRNVA